MQIFYGIAKKAGKEKRRQDQIETVPKKWFLFLITFFT